MMTLHIVAKDKYIEYDDEIIINGVQMRDDDWAERAKALLKAELKRRNVGYRELADKLTEDGSPDSERNIANKISRGGFTAAFFLQCLSVIGTKVLRLEDE